MVRRALTVLFTIALLLASACSDDDEQGDAADQPVPPSERVAAAADRTRAEGTARTAFESAVTGLGGGDETGSAAGEGLVDFEANRGSLDIDLGPLLAGAGVPGLDAQTETLYEGGLIYLRSDLVNSFLGVDTPWLRIDLEGSPGGAGAQPDLGPLASLAGNDPGDQLALLSAIDPASVQEVGQADVRGGATTLYTATVDLAAGGATAADEDERRQFERLVDQLGTDRLDVGVNLDAEGRVRRIAYSPPPGGQGAGPAVDVELEYYDFGAEVDLAIPAGDQVTDLADVPLLAGSRSTG